MAHKELRRMRKKAANENTALLFASAQLAADVKTFNHLLGNKYVDYNAIRYALTAIDGTRRIIKDALAGKRAVE